MRNPARTNTQRTIPRLLSVWLLLAVIAVANGIARKAVIEPATGEHAAHLIGTGILCALILLVSIATIRWIGPGGSRGALAVGLAWLALTVAFEFLAGHYLFGHPWDRLLADYNVLRGRVWSLVLLATLLSPWIAMRIRGS